jgi:RNA polymerase sigma factor (TIGR02999 family)
MVGKEGDLLAWRNRAHFVGSYVRAMKRVLIDHARRRAAIKRGRDWKKVALDDVMFHLSEQPDFLLELDALVQEIPFVDSINDGARKKQVAEIRIFGQLTIDEIAAVLGISRSTVMRDWKFVKAWLVKQLLHAHSS